MSRGALAGLVLLLACGSPEREKALVQLKAHTPAERARAVRALAAKAKPDDAEAWAAVSRAARDPSSDVRLAAAESLAAAPKGAGSADPEDTLGGLMADPRDDVRIAAVAALGRRCGPRAKGYLFGAFARSGPAVRAATGDALTKCGGALGDALAWWEARRRDRARQLLDSNSGAQRARAASELGLLGREQDVKALLPLLDDGDGVVVAAAAKGLGDAGAEQAEPRLRALLLDEATAIAASAAEGIAALGPAAVARSRVQLEQAALREDAAALPAALALLGAGDHRDVCKKASSWRNPDAARVLAALGSCPAQPLVDALAAARGDPKRASAALAALLALPEGAAPQAAAALAPLIETGPPDVAAEAARAAEHLHAKGAGRALVAVVRRERKAMQAERSAPRTADAEEDAHVAAELAQQAARVPAADRAKYDALMKKLVARGQAADARSSARARLSELLSGAPARRRRLLVDALQAAIALSAPGIAAEAAALKDDPEIEVARAARGEREPAQKQAPQEARDPQRARAAARLALLSDDGAERAAACAALREVDGGAAGPVLAPFARDPERRVRVACSSSAMAPETRAPKSR